MFWVNLAGRLGRDATLKQTSNGHDVAMFSVAVERRGGKGEKETFWVDCTLWRQRAVALSEYLTKGTTVAVCGPARLRTYTPKDGGEPKAVLEVEAVEVTLLGGGSGSNKSEGPAPSRAMKRNEEDFNDEIPF